VEDYSQAPVIAVIGNDAPRQLMLACGARPYRLTGSWTGAVDPRAQELLGAADATVTRLLADLLAGRDRIDALVVCNDSQAHLRLFYALRAMGWETPLHLLDMPRDDTPPARRFAASQYRALVDFCAGVSGRSPDAAALAAAAAAELAVADALARLRDRRRHGRCAGAPALEAALAASRLAPAEAAALIDATGADESAAGGIRLHLTGSDHPDPAVYRRLEERGCVIVSEDHDTGDGAWLGIGVDAGDVEDVIAGLVERHFARVASSRAASASERAELTARGATSAGADAVVALIRDLDEAPLWDLPDQEQALAERGVPFVVRSRIAPDHALPEAEAAAELVEAGVRR